MSNAAHETKYLGVEFYAEKTRKNGRRTGTVLVVRREIRNGQAFAAIGVPRDGRKALPIVTWTTDAYIARQCEEITESEARAMAPEFMRNVDAYQRSPEFRTMYQAEIVKAGRTTLQPAFEKDMGATKSIAAKFHELYGA